MPAKAIGRCKAYHLTTQRKSSQVTVSSAQASAHVRLIRGDLPRFSRRPAPPSGGDAWAQARKATEEAWAAADDPQRPEDHAPAAGRRLPSREEVAKSRRATRNMKGKIDEINAMQAWDGT